MRIILFVDDQCELSLPALKPAAEAYQFEIIPAKSVIEALELLKEYSSAIEAVILDLAFPAGQMQGEEGLKKIKKGYPEIPVVILTDSDTRSDITTAVNCIKDGAFDYIGKSTLNPTHLFHKVDNAIERSDLLKKSSHSAKNERADLSNIYYFDNQDKVEAFWGYKLDALIQGGNELDRELDAIAKWNLRMINAFTGSYNNFLLIRIRTMADNHHNKVSVVIGFKVMGNQIDTVKAKANMALADFENLINAIDCPYLFLQLQEPELKALWSFDADLRHTKFYRKPISIQVNNDKVGFKNNEESSGRILAILPPAKFYLPLDDNQALYQSMISCGKPVSITVTALPSALSLKEIQQLQSVISGKTHLPDDLLNTTIDEVVAYYKQIIPECRNNYFLSVVLSAPPESNTNSIRKECLRAYFGGEKFASYFIVEGNKSPSSMRLQDETESGALSFHYLSSEALNVFRLPFPGENISAFLPTITPNKLYLPQNIGDTGTKLGVKEMSDIAKDVFISEQSLKRHLYILGQTGTGKSTLIKTMALDLIGKGEGCCIIDPHGDLFDDIRKYIPSDREDDVIIFDTANLVGSSKLSLLDFNADEPETKATIIQELVRSLNDVYDMRQQGGFMFELFFRAAVLLAVDENSVREFGAPNLRLVKRIISDESFRRAQLKNITNVDVIDALKDIDKQTGDMSWSNFAPYINSKLAVFTDNIYTDTLFNAPKPNLNFRTIMDEKKILLVRFDKGQIGFNNLKLIGGVFLSKLIMAAMSRSNQPREARVPFYLFIDEFQNFLHQDVSGALAELRKYNISMVLANQTLGQLSQEMIDAVLGNVGNTIFFRPGLSDYHKIQHFLEPDFTREEILKLPNFNCIARLLIDNIPSDPFTFQTKNNWN